MTLYRGVEVSYESIREWCQKFGQHYANQIGCKRPYQLRAKPIANNCANDLKIGEKLLVSNLLRKVE